MITFAEVALVPDGILACAVVGCLAGFFAGVVMEPGRYGVVGDMIAGLTGAGLGGSLLGLMVGGTIGFLVGIVVAALAACTLIAAMRAVVPTTPRP
jgi:uncharacterized membrane protein YeaQ/YmgE (transglycosylase-associated protein family)